MKITYGQQTDTFAIRLKDIPVSESDELQEGMYPISTTKKTLLDWKCPRRRRE